MKIRFIDLKAQYDSIKNEIDGAIAGVINSSSFILGPAVSRFEENFARYCGCKYAVAVNSGTSALYLTLRALGVGRGDEVITAANTFIATVAAVADTGATPVLVDIDPETRNIDLNLIENAITPRTKIIMPVHLYGSMVDMETLGAIAKKHNLIVIEDAAQAHGATFKNMRAGSFGLAAGFSFYPAKNLGAYGEGGAIVTSDESLVETIKKLRDHGSAKKYHHELMGCNARMDGIQGAVLDVKLKYLDSWNQERNRVAVRYRLKLDGLPLTVPAQNESNFDVYHQFVVEVDGRRKLQDFLSENGIPTLIHYPIPVHKQAGFLGAGFAPGQFPVTERLAERILSLPIYPELGSEEIDYISLKIREFFGD
ncbi:MAG: DegT/DnrJ/EryC1/StrS family aminotransferase [Candidatus Zixiibacteriota bacterium]|nr:MAG: DegT/DnrJ/EryC1/StrS family aminotransferase [candidate division Zixibacteria bacterium]